ncbi:hypothetical protein TNCV_5074501 [Trichonephila clavipes]|nr:hypothetical protein TNCV_5074501 [Trichonephila clavipes]
MLIGIRSLNFAASFASHSARSLPQIPVCPRTKEKETCSPLLRRKLRIICVLTMEENSKAVHFEELKLGQTVNSDPYSVHLDQSLIEKCQYIVNRKKCYSET